jgi:hypothetical protein
MKDTNNAKSTWNKGNYKLQFTVDCAFKASRIKRLQIELGTNYISVVGANFNLDIELYSNF